MVKICVKVTGYTSFRSIPYNLYLTKNPYFYIYMYIYYYRRKKGKNYCNL